MRLAWVAVPVPALDLLTYLVPDSLDFPAIGARVLVPVGTRRMTGIVVRTNQDVRGSESERVSDLRTSGQSDPDSIRPIIDVIDDEPFLPGDVVELGVWLADY